MNNKTIFSSFKNFLVAFLEETFLYVALFIGLIAGYATSSIWIGISFWLASLIVMWLIVDKVFKQENKKNVDNNSKESSRVAWLPPLIFFSIIILGSLIAYIFVS